MLILSEDLLRIQKLGCSLHFKIFTVHGEIRNSQSILSHKMLFHFLHNCFTFPSPMQTITLKWGEKEILLSRWIYLLRQKNEKKMFQLSLHLFAINVKSLLRNWLQSWQKSSGWQAKSGKSSVHPLNKKIQGPPSHKTPWFFRIFSANLSNP